MAEWRNEEAVWQWALLPTCCEVLHGSLPLWGHSFLSIKGIYNLPLMRLVKIQ